MKTLTEMHQQHVLSVLQVVADELGCYETEINSWEGLATATFKGYFFRGDVEGVCTATADIRWSMVTSEMVMGRVDVTISSTHPTIGERASHLSFPEWAKEEYIREEVANARGHVLPSKEASNA